MAGSIVYSRHGFTITELRSCDLQGMFHLAAPMNDRIDPQGYYGTLDQCRKAVAIVLLLRRKYRRLDCVA